MIVSASPEIWLADEVAAGRVDTVALSFADRLGAWRGKRVPAREFVEHGPLVVGFCDGMIVCDVRCGVIEETPFSNFSTGYPDLHVTFDPREARPIGWRPGEAFVFGVPSDHKGEALPLAPVTVLAAVIDRLAGRGVAATAAAELSGCFFDGDRNPVLTSPADGRADLPARLLDALVNSWIPARYASNGFDRGSFVIGIDHLPPLELAQAIVVTKGAAKELARAAGLEAVFMTRRPGGGQPALLALDLIFDIAQPVDPPHLAGLLAEARPLLFPSVNAMRQPAAEPSAAPGSAGTRWRVGASAEADAATALATTLAAIGAAMDGIDPTGPGIDDLARSAALLKREWLRDWLGAPILENAVPLFEHEASLFAAAVTDWEIDRYWGVA